MISLQAHRLSEPVVIRLTALILVFFLTIPALFSISKQLFSNRRGKRVEYISNYYDDEDGVATQQAQKAYSTKSPKYSALTFTSIGLVVSIVSNVYSEVEPVVASRSEDWFTFGSWVGRHSIWFTFCS